MEASGSNSLKEEGLRFIKEGDYRKAVSVLDQLVETDPSDAQAFLYLGVAYFEMGNKAEAIAAFEQSVSVKASARGYFNLGLAYESVDRLGEAMTQFEHAVKLDNSYKSALDAIERLKKQGIEAKQSSVQWTIGTQSVAEEIAAKQAQAQAAQPQPLLQSNPGAAVPPAYQPGSLHSQINQPQGAPRPYLPGQYEAEKEAELKKHQRQMLKAGLIYGAAIGAIVRLVGNIFFGLFMGVGGLLMLLYTVLGGAVVGAIIGAICGYTGGGEETGQKVGAGLFGVYTLGTGLLSGLDIIWLIIPLLLYSFIGYVVGGYIGRTVEASIGWD